MVSDKRQKGTFFSVKKEEQIPARRMKTVQWDVFSSDSFEATMNASIKKIVARKLLYEFDNLSVSLCFFLDIHDEI